MAVESPEDRASFHDPDEFGEVGHYTVRGGSPVDLPGTYDAPHEYIDVGGDVTMSGSTPNFTCRDEDLPAGAAQDDTLAVKAGSFRVKDLQPDGSGMATITLKV